MADDGIIGTIEKAQEKRGRGRPRKIQTADEVVSLVVSEPVPEVDGPTQSILSSESVNPPAVMEKSPPADVSLPAPPRVAVEKKAGPPAVGMSLARRRG